MSLCRLDKLLSDSGHFTRSQARDAIRAGRVRVNGCVVRKPEEKFDAETDKVVVDGEAIDCSTMQYLMLYKPAGVLSATDDASQRTVLDLLSPELQKQGLFPVGRLDKDTTGLLLLTNDGDFAHRVTAPKKHVPKCYRATLDGPITQADVTAFADGILLGDGTQCLPARLEIAAPNVGVVTVFEGKYHQVKRMFAARGRTVTALHRDRIGALELDGALGPGEYRPLYLEERTAVFQNM